MVSDGDALAYRPLQGDVLRLLDDPITREDRHLRVDGEHARSLQALLVLGALPETVEFPGPGAELLFDRRSCRARASSTSTPSPTTTGPPWPT